MSPRAAAETAFAVAGVYLVAGSVPQAILGIDLGLHSQDPDALVRWVGVIGPVMNVACGAGLVTSRRSLALRLAPEAQEHVVENGTEGTHGAAISVVGVYFLATGLSGLIRETFRSFVPHSVYGTRLSLDNCAEPIAETATGLALFLGSRGIVKLWHGLRSAGRG